MANNPETVQWEAGIYQLETADLVTGGIGGVDNEPHRMLGNRTAFLKDRIDSVAAQVGIAADVTQTQLIQAAMLHVPTAAALRDVPIPAIPNERTVIIFAEGLTTVGDGSGGNYRWSYDADFADDGDVVIRPSSNPAFGRWIKINTNDVQAINLASGNNSNVSIGRATGFLDVTPVGGNAVILSFAAGFDGQMVTVTNLSPSLKLDIAQSAVRLRDGLTLLFKMHKTIKYSKTLGWVGM